MPSRRARFLAGIRQAPDFPRGKVWADCAVLMRRKKNKPFKWLVFAAACAGFRDGFCGEASRALGGAPAA
ncbi:MAG: hypothetical protein DBY30_04810 [Verrucomicrobia bacterium]|nr:MAG: hypothetical protein DBY30_04810 [Verrucomicrobiota bacterium]